MAYTAPPYQAPPPTAGGWGAQPYMPPPPVHYGAPDIESGSDGPKGPGMGFDDKSIRAGFIRKVYAMLFVMLCVVVAFICVVRFNDDAMMFVARNPWMYYVSYVAFLVVYIALACCRSVRRSFPANLICLIILTLSIAYMTAMITAFHKTSIVFAAMGICALVTLSISLFACNTKYDFTSWVGVMFVVFMVVFFFGIFAIIFSYMKPEYGGILMAVYGGLMALVFMVYLAIDTQMIIGGKKHEMSEEEHIFAAVQLFLDIIYIFWFLLSIMGFVSGGD